MISSQLCYLIVTIALGRAAIPIFALALIGAVYGLQAIVFILKREFMLVGWMIIYLLAYVFLSVPFLLYVQLTYLVQLSRLQLLPSHLLLLVHGRLQLG